MGNHATLVYEMKDADKDSFNDDDFNYHFEEIIRIKESNLYFWFKKELDTMIRLSSRMTFFNLLSNGFKSTEEFIQSFDFTPKVKA